MESFYGSPPQLFFTEIADFETSSRLYLLKCGAPCHLDVIFRWPFATKDIHEDIFFVALFLVSRSHETFVEENRCFFGGGYRRISPLLKKSIFFHVPRGDVTVACRLVLRWRWHFLAKTCFSE